MEFEAKMIYRWADLDNWTSTVNNKTNKSVTHTFNYLTTVLSKYAGTVSL